MNPAERASALESSLGENLAEIHQEAAKEGQTAAPDASIDVDLHFVCFVEKEGSLYELDGRNPFPINHGPCEANQVALKSAIIVQRLMALDPSQINFTVMALAGIQNE